MSDDNFRRLLGRAADQFEAFMSRSDPTALAALDAADTIGAHDLKQFDAGRLTAPVAALQASLATLRAEAGVSEPDAAWLTRVERSRLSIEARKVGKWLARHGGGDIAFRHITSSTHLSGRTIRKALGELRGVSLVELRPSISVGAIRVEILN